MEKLKSRHLAILLFNKVVILLLDFLISDYFIRN